MKALLFVCTSKDYWDPFLGFLQVLIDFRQGIARVCSRRRFVCEQPQPPRLSHIGYDDPTTRIPTH
ncbi:hypothetical protein MUDCAT_2 [Arthrobacter phage Mudcat]|uniref:Uncharacterized protein n=1 Tax=Arthrobacter phage Mudcat TaxID=1796997 RepID=A0A140G6T5_9CAUD|nr:hypothetical protein BI184_gp02 [Arthrobacter phage Mudcat]AMM44370.1 hypothetical protein MUDCAT_2 [Arthrobacter phage Mudcat]